MAEKIVIGTFIILYFITCFIALQTMLKKRTQHIEKIHNEHEEQLKKKGYIRPQFKELTQAEIDDIHVRGKITPAEMVREWESFGLCAPGDAIGSAAWRCKKFDNCHDCLVDYASSSNEYTSTKDIEYIPVHEIHDLYDLKI